MKITTKVLRELLDEFNPTLTAFQIRITRNLDDSINFDKVSNNSISILDDSGMTTREAYCFLKGMMYFNSTKTIKPKLPNQV